MAGDQGRAEPGTGRPDRRFPRPGDGIVWLPDLAALVAGGVGAAGLGGGSRWLCAAACGIALASLGHRLRRRDPAQRARPLRSAAASLPALLLLSGIVYALQVSSSGRFDGDPAAPSIRLDTAPPEARDCLASTAAQAYLDALHRHLDETWAAGDASGEGGFVVLGFILGAGGDVRFSRVIDQSSETDRALGTEALARAAPFGPLRGELACLAQIELRATLDRTSLR
ncbi:MAG: hypothetical protein IPK00_13325 [Deltaproteobacteria bacterium]|nr:hypothetical protein [Deltaproteobacteria bacterium]